jgi:hypothetical protein
VTAWHHANRKLLATIFERQFPCQTKRGEPGPRAAQRARGVVQLPGADKEGFIGLAVCAAGREYIPGGRR